MGILKVCLGVSFINSFFRTKLGASCQITSFPPVLGIRQMDTNISVETDSRYLNKLIRYLYYFFYTWQHTLLCSVSLLHDIPFGAGFIFSQRLSKYFSVGLSLLLNKESYYCKTLLKQRRYIEQMGNYKSRPTQTCTGN